MNYLSIVNDLIAESKQVLDPLTSVNFASPPRTVMYDRMKSWVKQSYIDVLEERREWFFTNERGVVTIQPRLHLAKIDSSYIPLVGDVLVGDQSGVRFELTEVFTDNEGQDRNDEYTVSVRYDNVVDPSQLIQWETFTALSGLNTYPEIGRVENRGTYRLQQYIPTIDWVDMSSITLKKSVLDPDFYNTPSNEMVPLTQLDWPQYLRHYDNFYAPPAHPRFVTKAPNGDLQFFPYPDALYDVAFDYEQTAPELEDWDDVPSLLPSKHHKLLVWKAMIELADFNNDRALYARANKKYLERLGWLMRDYIPEMTLETSLFYRR